MATELICNPEKFDSLLAALKKDGREKLHVVADFDGTLTSTMVNGKPVPSTISILRDGDYLTPEYRKKAHELYNYYRPFEDDPNCPIEKREKMMHEWWTRHFDLLVRTGLTRQDLESVVKNASLTLKSGAKEFLDLLFENNIPLLIISSSGIGDTIKIFLEQQNLLRNNVHVITNSFIWNDDGYAVGVKEPIIHALNKDETSLAHYPLFETIKNRTNILLLGDGTGDAMMAQGFASENILKIAFIHRHKAEEKKFCASLFDALIENENYDWVNKITREIIAG
ncbi:MAG TPA: hypothetical protein VJH75_03275 [Patescibacteria group bacterium]|nr:hypothetical protein [Patescibacteria group bacterium]